MYLRGLNSESGTTEYEGSFCAYLKKMYRNELPSNLDRKCTETSYQADPESWYW